MDSLAVSLDKSMDLRTTVAHVDGEAYARQQQDRRLYDNPSLRALLRILNGLDRQSATWNFDFFARPMQDRLRLERIAETAVSLLDPEIIEQAVEQMAEKHVEAHLDGALEDLPASCQAHERRLARSVFNAGMERLGRLRHE